MRPAESITKYLWPTLLGLSLLCRLAVYWQNRSLFLDEANLARNIAERSFAGFFTPLDYQQYAPPLFLVLEKISYGLAGASEWALRFWPLVMGGLALYGFYLILRKTVGTDLPALFVFYLFAFSQVYIRYGTELKQYSTDMAVSVGLLLAALEYPPLKNRGIRRWILLGSIAVWLSMPSIFLLAGIGLYFLCRYYSGEPSVKLSRLLLMGGMWLLQFGIYFFLILSSDLQKTELLRYHQPYFWPLWPDEWADWQQIGFLSKSLLSTLIGHTFPAIVLGVIGLGSGGITLWRRQEKGRLLLLIVPVLLSLFASGLGRYSLIERLSLFLMPLLGLLTALGLTALWKQSPLWVRTILVLAGLSVLPLRKGLEYLVYPLKYEEMRPLLLELGPQLKAGDYLWVDQYAQPAFEWYTRYDPVAGPWVELKPRLIYNRWDGRAAAELPATLDSTATVWLLFSHLVSDRNRLEMEQELEEVQERYGPPRQELRFPGAVAFGW